MLCTPGAGSAPDTAGVNSAFQSKKPTPSGRHVRPLQHGAATRSLFIPSPYRRAAASPVESHALGSSDSGVFPISCSGGELTAKVDIFSTLSARLAASPQRVVLVESSMEKGREVHARENWWAGTGFDTEGRPLERRPPSFTCAMQPALDHLDGG